MKKKIIYLLIGLITCLSFSFTFKASYGALSQDWVAIADFKNDSPRGLGIDSSGNIYVAGHMDNIGSGGGKINISEIETDIFLLKYDSLGVQQWNRTYEVNKIELCYDLALDSQDDIYLVGSTNFGGPSIFLLIKYSSSGHLQWNKTWGKSVEGASIKIDPFNNIFVCGTMENKADIFLQKYDTSGNLLWNRTWETPERYVATSMALDSSNNIYIGGAAVVNETSIPSIDNIILVKYNSLGVFQWNLTCQNPNRESCHDIIIDSLDNIYILSSPLNSEIRLRKYDNTGNLIWNATWGNPGAVNYGGGLAIDASDNIYITGGTSGDVVAGTHILVLKYDSTGDLKWNYVHGSFHGKGSAIKIDSSENIYVCGTASSIDDASDYYFDAFLLKLTKASDQGFIPGYNLPILTLSVFGIGIAFYLKKRKSFS